MSFFYLGCDSRALFWARNPIIILERVHRLQDGGDAPHVRVDLRVRQELRGQVRVELHLPNEIRVARIHLEEGKSLVADLHDRRGVYPEGWVEEAVVEQLLEQEVRVARGAGHQVLGQLQESLKKMKAIVLSLIYHERGFHVTCNMQTGPNL